MKRRNFPRIAMRALICLLFMNGAAFAQESSNPDAAALVRKAFDYYRGEASVSYVRMTIHRPDWERVMKIRVWTRGDEDSLFKIDYPPADEGNGTLKKGGDMWMYNPKINRVIKLPPSMMSQSWMGSDFSNNDLSKSDTLVKDYTHRITGRTEKDGVTVYSIESEPEPRAPVVWGMIRLQIREDGILMSEIFYDEDKEPVKTLVTKDIQMMGGKPFPAVWTISREDEKEKYTRIEYLELDFKDSLPSHIFTMAGLKKRIRR